MKGQMPDSDSPSARPQPGRGADAAAREAERRERLAAALRENLKKRKAPERAKRERPDPQGGSAT